MKSTGKEPDKHMKRTREISSALCVSALILVLAACDGGDGRNAGVEVDTPQENTTVGGMFDTNTPAVQQMQSFNYIAEGQVSYSATREVYATSDKYRMQPHYTILSTSH